MELSGVACPACGASDTQSAEEVWDSRHLDSGASELAERIAPPVPRVAATNAAAFYLFGVAGLVGWVLAMTYLIGLVQARASAVFFVACVAVAGGLLQVIRLFTATPKPTSDQVAALEEWQIEHRQWQRKRVCLRCGHTFLPGADDDPK